jgi:hypothetical protein
LLKIKGLGHSNPTHPPACVKSGQF